MINDWHEKRGFGMLHEYSGTKISFGYHYLILNGRLWSVQDYDETFDGYIIPGRPENANGAHCKANGRNMDSLGICLIGPPYTGSQYASLVALCISCMRRYGILSSNVHGHREEDPKRKKDPQINMDNLRKYLREHENQNA
jgi:hypothetical protein